MCTFHYILCIYNKTNIMKENRKTILISEKTHKQLKKYCKDKSLVLSSWVDKLILISIEKNG